MMIMTKAETLYFNRLKAKGKLKTLNESAMQKLIKELNEKLPLNLN